MPPGRASCSVPALMAGCTAEHRVNGGGRCQAASSEAQRRRREVSRSSAEAEAETESTHSFDQIPAGKRKRPSAMRMKGINLFPTVSDRALQSTGCCVLW